MKKRLIIFILYSRQKVLFNSKRIIFCIYAFNGYVQIFVVSVINPFPNILAPPGWLSGKHVELVTWWLRVRYPVEANLISSVFSPLTSAKTSEKSSWWLLKESCVSTGVRKQRNTCVSPTAMI